MTLLTIFIYILFSLLVFVFAIATGAMLFAARRLQPDRITGHIPDTLILLGCKIRTRSIESRIRTAADWMKDHPDTICICSGGQGKDEDISEAEYMKEGLTAQGIDWKRLPMERNSTNTKENLALSHRVIASLGRGDSAIIITSAFHCYRAVFLGRREGLHCLALPAPNPRKSFLFFYVREVVAIWVMWLGEFFFRSNYRRPKS